MIFEDLPTTPRSEELVDKAFSRAARAGRAKSGREAQESMLRTACNVVADNADNVVRSWPDFGTVDQFDYEIADAVLRRTTDSRRTDEGEQVGLDALRASLSEISWAARQTRQIRDETMSKLRRSDTATARKHRKQAFARVADVVEEVEADFRRVGAARDALRDLPEIRPDEPTVAVAGYPNVGKSSFVNAVTRASNETAAYPFTTRAVQVGHVERDHVRYQIVDTPGVLDRPAAERNEIERQAESAITHLADAVIFVVDASASCGYPLDAQLRLRDELVERFDAPVLTVRNKTDRADETEAGEGVDADAAMSVETGDGTQAALEAAIDAVTYEPEIPPSRRE
ncbi:MAG: NOG1 family protein [Haloferacaceae archaeon]